MSGGLIRIFLDFDDTLFSQKLFYAWLDDFLAQYNVPKGTFQKSCDTYHAVLGAHIRLYDHEGHFKSITGRKWNFISAEIEAALLNSKTDFCFPETHGFLEKLVQEGYAPRILTYGDPAFQYFKINTCSVVQRLKIPKHVVTEEKSQFLAKEYPHGHGVLVDDKGPLNLPSNWTHIWLRRKNNGPVMHDDVAVYISDLLQFDEAMKLIGGR